MQLYWNTIRDCFGKGLFCGANDAEYEMKFMELLWSWLLVGSLGAGECVSCENMS